VRTRAGPALTVAVLALMSSAGLYACSADLLSFGGGLLSPFTAACDSSLPWLPLDAGGSGLPWTPFGGGTELELPVEGLIYSNAYQLCVWIDQGQDPCSLPTGAPGYATGPSAQCFFNSATAPSPSLAIVWLGLDECVANIMHSPCAARVADLVTCVQYFGSHTADLDCNAASVACAAYERATGCSETVIQANPAADTGDAVTAACATSLPIVPDVTCPPAPSDIPDAESTDDSD